MKVSTMAERLVLYKVNRGIARPERAEIKARALRREEAGYQAAIKEFMMWAKRYPEHPYLAVVNQEIEHINQDLRLNEFTRARRLGIAFANALRIFKNQLSTVSDQSKPASSNRN